MGLTSAVGLGGERERAQRLATAAATRWTRAALAAIAATALALRLAAIGRVPPDPFYDAAVRTMAQSPRAFLVGALEPGTRVAIDKPPLALWLQVASTQLFGFDRFALQLPVALAGVLAVVLLFDLVRRLAGPGAGLAAALLLAVAPIAVLTDRSDTMDGVMAALLVLSAWLIVRAAESERPWLLWAAGAAAGLAFEVKLVEALIAVPALAVLAAMSWPGRRRHLLGAAGVFVVVALAWLTAISLLPAGQRPYALGSADGSEWSIVAGYNGVSRVSGVPASTDPHIGASLSRPGPLRLLGAKTDLGARVGVAIVTALAFGLLALAAVDRRALRQNRISVAALAALAVWLACGLVVFSAMQHLHARYLVQLAAPLAAAAGVGVVALARAGARRRWWRLLAVAAFAAVVAISAATSVDLVRTAQNDAGQAGQIEPPILRRLSAYLIAHQGTARDEVAVESPFTAAAVVVHDGRPVLVLDNPGDAPLVPVASLRAEVRRGEVRYALLGAACRSHSHRRRPGCADSRWVQAHGTDVTAAAGLWTGAGHTALYRLASPEPAPTAAPALHRVATRRLPAPVQLPGVAVAGGRLLAAAGLDAADTSVAGVVAVAGAGVVRPRTVATLPRAIHDVGAAGIGTGLYVFGGGSASGVTDAITATGPSGRTGPAGRLPAVASDLEAATIGRTAYVVGGYTGSVPLRSVLAFTPGQPVRVVAELPHPLRYAAVAAVGGAIVIAGGTDDVHARDEVIRVDPRAGRARVIGHLPHPVEHAAGAALGGTFYVFGGRGGDPASQRREIVAIDPGSGRVRRAGELPVALSDAGAGTLGGRIWVVGGRTSGGTVVDRAWAFAR